MPESNKLTPQGTRVESQEKCPPYGANPRPQVYYLICSAVEHLVAFCPLGKPVGKPVGRRRRRNLRRVSRESRATVGGGKNPVEKPTENRGKNLRSSSGRNLGGTFNVLENHGNHAPN